MLWRYIKIRGREEARALGIVGIRKGATHNPEWGQFIANSSPLGNNAGKHAHPCALARMANPSRGGGAKPRGLLAGRWPGCRTAAAEQQCSALRGEPQRMQPHIKHSHTRIVVRFALVALLRECPDFELVGEAAPLKKSGV